jgi:hypothetical protein
MTKNEALQLFLNSVDMIDLEGNFPDVDFVVTELSDGQQEIIIRLQGEDTDFRPTVDLSAIDSMTMDDLPDGSVRSKVCLEKCQRKMTRIRNQRRDIALLKRIESLISPAGVSLRDIAEVIQRNLPVEDVEL